MSPGKKRAKIMSPGKKEGQNNVARKKEGQNNVARKKEGQNNVKCSGRYTQTTFSQHICCEAPTQLRITTGVGMSQSGEAS